VSFDNNGQSVVVTIPVAEGFVDVAMKLDTASFKGGSTSAATETFSTTHALLVAIVALGTLTLLLDQTSITFRYLLQCFKPYVIVASPSWQKENPGSYRLRS
jgi:hypothetical protein